MPGINPVSVPTPPLQPSDAGPARQGASGGKADLGSLFGDVLDKVDQDQQKSALAIQDLIAGRSQDVLSVVSEVAKADLSFKLLIGVRNKIIEAYKQTMNMQV
jgi:flagellar hook-basal body complex protein FliE